MTIKICVCNINSFTKIEQALNKFDKDFISNFEIAEYAMEGLLNDIKLSTESFYKDKIVLPKGFSIEEVNNNAYSIYEKDAEGNIKEKVKYQIIIHGTFQNQMYKLIYSNLLKVNTTICCF